MIHLRPINPDDRWRLYDWRNRPEVARWMYTDHAITPDEHDRWFSRALADATRAYWVIEADGEPVGLVNLYDIDPANSRAAWAYYLASDAARGRGVGAFVEFLVLEHVFIELRLNKLWCEVITANEAVTRLHLSFGFRQEAVLRAHVRKAGQFVDVIGLGLLRDEWLARRAASAERLAGKGHPAVLRAVTP